jgi:hypothetical protein
VKGSGWVLEMSLDGRINVQLGSGDAETRGTRGSPAQGCYMI